MKTKWCVAGFLVLVLYAGIPLLADESFKSIKAKAENGDAEAQNDLGFCYATGSGITKDATVAVKWYQKAAEQRFRNAECNLGAMYANGDGVEKDSVQAVIWFRKAAEQGFSPAQYNLGLKYETGDGVRQDYAEAVKWYRKAADHGLAAAQSNLGALYADGNGISQDYAEAIKWYQRAAEGGDSAGQFNLGTIYSAGHGVVEDASMAVKWWRRSAQQGEANAQYNLGANYANGNGVLENYIEAYKWISLASAQGNQVAKKWLITIEFRMAPEQIAEAQRLASEFVPRRETPSSGSDNASLSNNPQYSGTGFFITDDGYLISNYHVVKDATKVRLLASTGLLDASEVKVDAANDLAMLKVGGAFKPLAIAASRMVKLGSTVATVGFPDIGLQGFAPKLAKGEIASLTGAADDPRYFQVSVPVQPGNSGGALVDAHGNLVGIVSAKLDASAALAATGSLPENVNYAVKSSLLLSFLESVPDVSAKLKEPNTKDESFEEVAKSAQDAAVLVLVY